MTSCFLQCLWWGKASTSSRHSSPSTQPFPSSQQWFSPLLNKAAPLKDITKTASQELQHSQQWNRAAWEQLKQGKRVYPVSTTLLEHWWGYHWHWTSKDGAQDTSSSETCQKSSKAPLKLSCSSLNKNRYSLHPALLTSANPSAEQEGQNSAPSRNTAGSS